MRMSMVYGAGCGAAEFRCKDGRCVGYELQCNKVKDCSDGSDELDCGNYIKHTNIQFTISIRSLLKSLSIVLT